MINQIYSIAARNILLAFIIGLGFSSCRDLSGQLQLNTEVKIKTKKGHKTLSAGNYSALVDFRTRKKIKFEITDGTQNSSFEVKLKKPIDVSVPGSFTLPAVKTGQSFDIIGETFRRVTNSPMRTGTVTCTRYVRVRRCFRHCPSPNRGRRCVRRCQWGTRPVNGWQNVDYYDRTTTTEIDLRLNDVSSRYELGSFTADRTQTQRIFSRRGVCSANRFPPI